MLEILEELKPFDGILSVYCEDGDVVELLRRRTLAQGCTGPESHPLTRLAETEAEAIERLCWLGRMADAPVHVVHLSSVLGWEEVCRARCRGGVGR